MNNNWVKDYARRIHMDFHTPDVPWERAMKDFDVKKYVSILKDANVNSLVSFTKCHHGYSYYDTSIGLRHPSLPDGLDMFGEILKECHSNDMKVMAYYSIGWLTTIQKNQPDWMERNIKGEMLDTQGNPKEGPWANICLNSPYLEEVVLPELTEILNKYDADGLWLDIIECNPCHCEHCKEKYRKQFNKELPDNDDELTEFVVQTKKDFIHRCRELTREIRPNWIFTYNTAGRDKELVEEVDFNSIETHPGLPGDKEAWTRALVTYKFLQKYNKPWESCTSRFIHGWGGWDDQPVINNTVVMSRIIAHGGMINLGDQAYPNATLDEELYKRIGQSFDYLEPRIEVAEGSTSVPYIALLTTKFDIYAHSNANYFGAAKILSENHWHFDIIDTDCLDSLDKYECVIMPEIGELDTDTVEKLKLYVKNGGKILATGNSALDESNNKFQLDDVYGVDYLGKSDYSIGFLKCNEELAEGIRKSSLLIPGRFNNINIKDGAEEIAEFINPVIEPKYDEFYIFRNALLSPPGDKADTAGVVCNHYGAGICVYFPTELFKAFNQHSQWYISDIVNNALNVIIKDKKINLRAPKTVELNVTETEDKTICHLIQYCTYNESDNVREVVPVYDIELSIASDKVKGKKAMLMPEGKELNINEENGMLTVKLDKLEIYSQVVFS